MVQVEVNHRLITDGPYKWLRHPAYSGMILVDAGIALALGSWIGFAAALSLVCIASLYRIRIEERVLLDTFGQGYADYARRTWRLFPGP